MLEQELIALLEYTVRRCSVSNKKVERNTKMAKHAITTQKENEFKKRIVDETIDIGKDLKRVYEIMEILTKQYNDHEQVKV